MSQPYSTNKEDLVFTVQSNINESTAASAVTVSSNGNNNRQVKFLRAFLSCSVACSFTLERGGTAPTTTAATINQVNPTNPQVQSSQMFAWTASNVGSDTNTLLSLNLAAGIPYVLNLEEMGLMIGAGIKDTVTIKSQAVSGNVGISILWKEQ